MGNRRRLGGAARVQSMTPPAAPALNDDAGNAQHSQPFESVNGNPTSTAKKSRRRARKKLPALSGAALVADGHTVYPPQPFDRRVNAGNRRWAGYRPRWLIDAGHLGSYKVAPILRKEFPKWAKLFDAQ